MDGHTGISNESKRKVETDFFSLVLAFLKDAQDNAFFILHIKSKKLYSYGLQPIQFLQDIGMTKFKGNCKFHQYDCYYHVIAHLEAKEGEYPDLKQIDAIYNGFHSFAKKIDHLFTLCREEKLILEEIFHTKGPTYKFDSIAEINTQSSIIPPWVDEYIPEKMLDLEERRKEIEVQINEIQAFLPLLYGTGDILEDATLKALKYLGLEAYKTEPGFTVDILTTNKDIRRGLGIEVTGINGPIKKDNRKLIQIIDFERIKENNEKSILIANTHNNIPISDREALDNFSGPCVEFLAGYDILLMTSYQLFRMVLDVMEERKTTVEVLSILLEERGVLIY